MPHSSTPWSRLSQAQPSVRAEEDRATDHAAQPKVQTRDSDHVAPTHSTLLLGGTATVIALLAVLITLFTGYRTSTPAPEVVPPRATSSSAAVIPEPAPTPASQGRTIAVGRVATTDGATLRIESLLGTTTTVHTTSSTKVHVLFGSRVADISAGSVIAAYGHKHADGSITATYLAGAGLDFTR